MNTSITDVGNNKKNEEESEEQKTMVNNLEIEVKKFALTSVGKNAKNIVDFLKTNESANTKIYYGCAAICGTSPRNWYLSLCVMLAPVCQTRELSSMPWQDSCSGIIVQYTA